MRSSFQNDISNTAHVIMKPHRQGCYHMWSGWYE